MNKASSTEMGVLDLSTVFDILDPSCRGYLTSTEVQVCTGLKYKIFLCICPTESIIVAVYMDR